MSGLILIGVIALIIVGAVVTHKDNINISE